MPAEISYATKIVGISRVLLKGKVEYKYVNDISLTDEDGWHIGKDNLEEFLQKLDGEHVSVEIKVIGSKDESHLDV